MIILCTLVSIELLCLILLKQADYYGKQIEEIGKDVLHITEDDIIKYYHSK